MDPPSEQFDNRGTSLDGNPCSGFPRWVWVVFCVLVALCVPWYFPPSAAEFVGPLPIWAWVTLCFFALLGGFTAYACLCCWPDSAHDTAQEAATRDGLAGPAGPSGGARRVSEANRERLEPEAVDMTDPIGRHHSIERLAPDGSSFSLAEP